MELKPIRLSPMCRQTIWGGTKLRDEFHKPGEGLENIAESWELTVRDDGMNRIVGGEFDGKTMKEYLDTVGWQVVGTRADPSRFPLLIKFIDARDDLSIQVHPNDDYALAHTTDLGKTEMWYIMEAEPDAKLVYGLKKGVTTVDLQEALEVGNVEDMLNYVTVKAGETYFIPSGLVHAIGSGILLAEIQQNSNITYRVYDYGRKQKDGTLRELHVADAMNVIVNRSEDEIRKLRFSRGEEMMSLANCEYFSVKQLDVFDTLPCSADANSFHSILCLDGNGTILFNGDEYPIGKGDSYFIPAGMGEYMIKGEVRIILSKL